MAISKINSVTPISNGGTGATTVGGALTALGLGGLNVSNASIAAESSTQITMPNNEFGLIVTTGASGAIKGMFVYNTASGGTVSISAIGTAPSGISTSAATNKLTITNSSSYVVRIVKIKLND